MSPVIHRVRLYSAYGKAETAKHNLAMSSASPSNSMNPFALTDEDESPPVPSTRHPLADGQPRRGPTTGLEDRPDGLPRGINYNSIFQDQDQEGEGADDDGHQIPYDQVLSRDAHVLSHDVTQSSTDIHTTLPESDLLMAPDSEIPSIDPESTAPTANASMYMSYRPSSNATSQRMYRSADSVSRNDGNPDGDLASSSTPQPHDAVNRKSRNSQDTTVRRWKGKARDLEVSTEERGPMDPFMNDSSLAARSRSRSHESSASSVGVRTGRGSDDRLRAAGDRNLLPMPVTSPPGNPGERRKPGSSHGSIGDVLFDAEAQDGPDETRPVRKPKSERHRHHKRRHHRKHSSGADRIANDDDDDLRASDERIYPAEEFHDDPHAMLMSTRSSRTQSRAGKHGKSARRRTDPTAGLSERERALWLWANVVDLDGYLQEVWMASRMS